MTTLAVLFKDFARTYLPHHCDLRVLDDSINDSSRIDEIMFAKGEYIGGMATAILAIVEASQQTDDNDISG